MAMEDFSQLDDPEDYGHSGVQPVEMNVKNMEKIKKKFSREDYTTRDKYFKKICEEFDVVPVIDLFADADNCRCKDFFDAQVDALHQDWPGPGEGVLWCNPPWSLWPSVALKVACTPCQVVCIAPGWGTDWLRLLLALSVKKIYFEVGCRFFQVDGKVCKGIRWPLWALLVHSSGEIVDEELLDDASRLGLGNCLVVPSWTLSKTERRRIRRTRVKEKFKSQE